MYFGLMLLALPISIVGGNYKKLYYLQEEREKEAQAELVRAATWLYDRMFAGVVKYWKRWREYSKVQLVTVTKARVEFRTELGLLDRRGGFGLDELQLGTP